MSKGNREAVERHERDALRGERDELRDVMREYFAARDALDAALMGPHEAEAAKRVADAVAAMRALAGEGSWV